MGDMLELGELSAELHYQIGREAAQSGVDAIVLVGTWVKAAASGALEGGLEASDLVHFATTDEASRAVGDLVREGDVILIKGSRGMAMERIVRTLEERWGPPRND
jgi:UDP-N-acetylmuramoyl-tripeptide--D-alanyl-D-alanine ligase